MIYWEQKDKQFWNEINKPEIVDVEALDCDIVGQVVLDNLKLAFLLQREYEQNNVVCVRLSRENNIRCIKMMYFFMIILLRQYNVRYVRIHGRYAFLRRFKTVVRKSKCEFFCDLEAEEYNLLDEIKELYSE